MASAAGGGYGGGYGGGGGGGGGAGGGSGAYGSGGFVEYVSVRAAARVRGPAKQERQREREKAAYNCLAHHKTLPHTTNENETAQYQASHTSRAAADAGQGDTREVSTPPGD